MRTFADIVSNLKINELSAEYIQLAYEMAASPTQYEHVSKEDKITLLQLMSSYAQELDPQEKQMLSDQFDELLKAKFQ